MSQETGKPDQEVVSCGPAAGWISTSMPVRCAIPERRSQRWPLRFIGSWRQALAKQLAEERD